MDYKKWRLSAWTGWSGFLIFAVGLVFAAIDIHKLQKENAELRATLDKSKNPCVVVIAELPNLPENAWHEYMLLDTCQKKMLWREFTYNRKEQK